MNAYEDYIRHYAEARDEVYENEYLENEARADEADNFGTDEEV